MNPVRLVSGAIALPAHAAAAVIGASVGVATTGARATARVLGRVVERTSAAEPVPTGPWPGARSAAAETVPSKTGAENPAAKKTAATKTAAKKTAAKKTAARKPARKAPSKQAAVLAPALGLSEDEVAAVTADDPVTPAGIPAAGEGVNPDTTETDLHHPGTEPLMDPATVKAVASESEVLQRAADLDKG